MDISLSMHTYTIFWYQKRRMERLCTEIRINSQQTKGKKS